VPQLARLFNLSDLNWGDWIYGLISAFIAGGSSAVVSGFVVAINDPKDYNFSQWKFYYLVFSVFAASGTLNFFAYLKQNPVPTVRTVTEAKIVETGNEPHKTIVTEVKTTTTAPSTDTPKPVPNADSK
jgi:hypothetical protein